MGLLEKLLHVLRWTVVAVLTCLLCLAVFLKGQQLLLRWRAERLLKDMQAIELHKTGWNQAQRLMWRWGAWGHYDGTCTEQACKYWIFLDNWDQISAFSKLPIPQPLISEILDSPIGNWTGGRTARIYAGFIVQDGTVWRTQLGFMVNVPPHIASKDDDYGYGLIVRAQSRSSLNRLAYTKRDHWILGNDEQLAEHPYYKAGRPGGCEICMLAEVTYSITTPQSEIRRLTDFNLSCITRWLPCTRIEDLLPAARPWHLYHLEVDSPEPELKKERATPCGTPVWALGRDAITVYAVDVLSAVTEKSKYDGQPYEVAQIRLIEALKGETPWPSGTVLKAYPYAGEFVNPPFHIPESLTPGKKYLVLVVYPFPNYDAKHPEPPEAAKEGPYIKLNRCGVLADTPRNRAELKHGFAMNDDLRVPEF